MLNMWSSVGVLAYCQCCASYDFADDYADDDRDWDGGISMPSKPSPIKKVDKVGACGG